MGPEEVERNVMQRALHWALRLASSIWNAFLAALEAISLALLLGLVCLRASQLLAVSHPLSSRLAEHLGVAFFVAAIAVFGYEWKSHSKDLLATTIELKEVLKAQYKSGAERCITGMFAGDDLFRLALRSNLIAAINASSEVVAEDVWNRDLAVGMIEALLGCATAGANKFKDTKVSEEHGFLIELPQPAQLVDKMLTTQMKKVGAGGTYVVISDYTSFQLKQLKDSFDETRACVGRGGKVSRLFFCYRHDRGLPAVEIERIAREHWELACELPGGYDVRFAKLTLDGVEPAHEGVFTSATGSVSFTILKPDLHQIRFFSLPQGGNPHNFDKLFNQSLSAANDPTSILKFGKYLATISNEWARQAGHTKSPR
jgi:hypothetical protein